MVRFVVAATLALLALLWLTSEKTRPERSSGARRATDARAHASPPVEPVTPGKPTAATTPAADEARWLRFEDAAGSPLAGIRVWLEHKDAPRIAATTDDQGMATFPASTPPGPHYFAATPYIPYWPRRAVRFGETIRARRRAPLMRVLLVDPVSGAVVPGGRVLLQDGLHLLPERPSGVGIPTPTGDYRLRIVAPVGYAPPLTVLVRWRIARAASSLVLRVPLRPPTPPRPLRFVDDEGQPIKGARITSIFALGHVEIPFHCDPTDAQGHLTLTGLPPHAAREDVVMTVQCGDEYHAARPSLLTRTPIVLGVHTLSSDDGEIVIEDRPVPIGIMPGREGKEVRVHVRDRLGRDARAGIRARLSPPKTSARFARTDESGSAWFTVHEAGSYGLRIEDSGFAPTAAEFSFDALRDVAVELREPTPVPCEVLVLRKKDRTPVPYAQLVFAAGTDVYAPVAKSGEPIQSIGWFTNRAGRVVLPFTPSRVPEVYTDWSGQATVRPERSGTPTSPLTLLVEE